MIVRRTDLRRALRDRDVRLAYRGGVPLDILVVTPADIAKFCHDLNGSHDLARSPATRCNLIAGPWPAHGCRGQTAIFALPNASCGKSPRSRALISNKARKRLKAAAVVAVGDIERSHSLVRLLNELAAAGKPASEDVVRACQILERYYAATRYPDALGGIDPGEIYTETDATQTLRLARLVVAFSLAIASEL